jgi:hypothetical protein
VDSLAQVEHVALAETPAGTRLEIVDRVSSAKAHDLRRVLSRHANSNGSDADTWPGCRWLTRPGCTRCSRRRRPRRRWTAACGPVIGSP